jgi:putative intracellular protease/amidase
MKQKAYHLVFDGLADWETPYALCAITRSEKLDVVTVGFTDKPITTMGGLKLTPEITLHEVSPAEAGIFILPGGDWWEQNSSEELIRLLHRLHTEKIPIAAICGATLEIARAGLTRNTRHTSNSKDYLRMKFPDYQDEAFYVEAPAVTDNDIITATSLGSIEFGREVIKVLHLFEEAETREWFEMYKHGVIPARYKTA